MGELSASLGQTRAALQTFATENGFDRKSDPAADREMAELRKKLARHIDQLRKG